ncbi:MAG: nitronate monooxygenase [Pseudomonadota bacterium]
MSVEAFRELFRLDVGLVQGPMGGVAGPKLVAAVSNAGALGVLPIWARDPAGARRLMERTSALARRPYAVNLRADLVQTAHVAEALAADITLFHLFWGDPAATAREILAGGGRFIATVGDAEAARIALDAGACALVAQGVEAGGHVLSETPLEALLAEVLPLAAETPVLAAGGIVTPEDAARALVLGASGVLCGSRFVASDESEAHDDYKLALVEAGADATVRSLCYDLGWSEAPHRTLVTETYRRWAAAGAAPMGDRPGEEDVMFTTAEGTAIPRYFVAPPAQGMQGQVLEGALYAGSGVERISATRSAADLVADFAAVLA